MKIYKHWLVALISAVLVYAGIVLLYLFAGNASEIAERSGIKTGQRNYVVAYVEDGKITLVSTYENQLIAFDENNNKLWQFNTNGPVREIKVDEKSRTIYAGCEDRNLYVFDADKGTLKNTIKVQRRIYSIDINSDASLIAVSAGINVLNHDILLYDGNGKELWVKQVGSIARKVCFNEDYSKLLIATNRAEILEYDLKGEETGKNTVKYQIMDMAIDRETGKLAVISERGVFDLLDKDLKIMSTKDFGGKGTAVAVATGGKWFGIGDEEGKYYIVDALGKTVYMSNFGETVTSINFTSQKVFITGLGDDIYQIEKEKLNSIDRLGRFVSLAGKAVYIFPFILCILLIMSFETLRDVMTKFFRALIKHRTAYIMLIPTFALLAVFCYYPVFMAFIKAFTNWNIHETYTKFIGLDNFRMMIEEGYFLLGVKNLAIIITAEFAKVLTVPLLVAELVFLMRSDKRKYWFRFLFVLPMVVPGVVSALMWSNIYDPNIGLLNQILEVLGLDSWKRVWLGDPKTALGAIIGMGFPYISPFAFLVYYGGLINIPTSLFEAAKSDGSNGWWNFTRIHLPLISSQMKMLIILEFIGAVQNFFSILLLTGGGPGTATYTPGLELYYNATRFGRYGYACALGIVMFIAILIGTLLNMKIKTISDYEG